MTSWLTLRILPTLRPVLLELIVLLTFNGLIILQTLLALHTLRLVALREQTGLLIINALASSLTLLAKTGLILTLTSEVSHY